jgi:hypothetical protein
LRKEFTERKKNAGVRTQKKRKGGHKTFNKSLKRVTLSMVSYIYIWSCFIVVQCLVVKRVTLSMVSYIYMVMFHCCTMPSNLETDINAKHSPRSGQTGGRTTLSINPNSCRINLCIERRKDSFLKFYKYRFVEL